VAALALLVPIFLIRAAELRLKRWGSSGQRHFAGDQ